MKKLNTRLKNFFYIPFVNVGSKNRLPAPQGRGASPEHLFFGEVEGRGTLARRGAYRPIPYPLTSQGVPLPTNRGKGSLGSRWS